MAPDSYEERVLGLVQGKRVLFDNVVDPEASENVVGVSKRLAEVLADDLTSAGGGAKDQGESPATTEPEVPTVAPVPDAEPITPAVGEPALLTTQPAAAGADLGGPALDLLLLLGALLCAAALLTGRPQAPSAREAAIWLYGEALPTGAIDPVDAALVMRAIALAQAADAVPVALADELASDTGQFVRRVIGRAQANTDCIRLRRSLAKNPMNLRWPRCRTRIHQQLRRPLPRP